MHEINWITFVCQLLGGLGLFLFGMRLMSDGLQKSAGDSLRSILERLTSNRVIGAMVGIVVTAMVQSSSATTVMVVGFVNAGLMNLTQALSVVLGANVGTTVTAQLIAFKITSLALPAIGVGVFLRLFSRISKLQYWGEILIGFGLLFLGLQVMTDGFVPLRKSAMFREAFIYFSVNPLAAAFAGAVLTMLVQSSSATMGITIALASTGLIDFYAAAAFVLGENIGTTITANIAAIGANKTAKRAALGHFLFNALGVAYMLILLTFFTGFVDSITPGDPNFVNADGFHPYAARHIANVHTLFNLINIVIFLPMIGFLALLCERIIPGADIPDADGSFLDENLIETPDMAVRQARKEVHRMSGYALEMLIMARKALFERDLKLINRIYELEGKVDRMEKEIGTYLVKLYQTPMTERNSRYINSMMHVLHDIEKIGDYSESIARYAEKMIQEKMTFSDTAREEMADIFDVAIRFCTHVFEGYNTGKFGIWVDTADENLIDQMKIQFKNNHMDRLSSGVCSVAMGMLFVDILNKLEKVGDNAFNIAQVLVQRELG
ncbi:Na/Pi cotransporter family protein [Desulfobotulus sp.]|jgi:phosphate:Na+ symporter|uniref:Na/Pi cotransporter family protein n=1 Tax=Desulfobotulus sp. TaxID=1940337 RepID=UPI002A36363C|nr:Na/Pi cotransporter family protein [Desulfobotulus sp.]MDY0162017.1 Na/Pi cotransporter family protein [Desulfobotulus sp.]